MTVANKTATEQKATTDAPTHPRWIDLALGILFGLFFAFDVWEAIENVIVFSTVASQVGASVTALSWVFLVLLIILPIVLFAIAYLVGRRRGIVAKILLYLAAIGVSSATSLSIVSIFLVIDLG